MNHNYHFCCTTAQCHRWHWVQVWVCFLITQHRLGRYPSESNKKPSLQRRARRMGTWTMWLCPQDNEELFDTWMDLPKPQVCKPLSTMFNPDWPLSIINNHQTTIMLKINHFQSSWLSIIIVPTIIDSVLKKKTCSYTLVALRARLQASTSKATRCRVPYAQAYHELPRLLKHFETMGDISRPVLKAFSCLFFSGLEGNQLAFFCAQLCKFTEVREFFRSAVGV